MPDWTRVMTNVAIGGGAGALSQLAENSDRKKQAERVKEGKPNLKMMEMMGTYVDYGLPILAVLASVTGMLRGWDEKLLIAGSALAGKRAVWSMTKEKTEFVPWTEMGEVVPALGTADPGLRRVRQA